MDRPASSDRMVDEEEYTEVALLPTTSIPIREEFRIRRFWFFYHDLRALTASWIPLPLFLIYRFLLFIYISIWLILHIVQRREEFGPHYLIFFTNLSYIILVVGTGAIALLTLGYAIVHYTSRETLQKYHPKHDSPLARIYSQDNINWYMKIVWILYILGANLALMVTAAFYTVVIDYSCSNDDNSAQQMNSTNSSGDGGLSIATCNSIDTVDVYSAHVHGVNALLIIIDLFLSRVPYQFLHSLYGLLFSLPYTIFTVIYWAAGGTNHLGDGFVYRNLNYAEPESVGLAIVLIIIPIPFFIVLFLLAWLRDVIYVRIGCCFRDIHCGSLATETIRVGAASDGEGGKEMEDVV